jgi:hypothetical protein
VSLVNDQFRDQWAFTDRHRLSQTKRAKLRESQKTAGFQGNWRWGGDSKSAEGNLVGVRPPPGTN